MPNWMPYLPFVFKIKKKNSINFYINDKNSKTLMLKKIIILKN